MGISLSSQALMKAVGHAKNTRKTQKVYAIQNVRCYSFHYFPVLQQLPILTTASSFMRLQFTKASPRTIARETADYTHFFTRQRNVNVLSNKMNTPKHPAGR